MVYDITKRNPDDLKSNTPVNKSVKIHSPRWGLRYLKRILTHPFGRTDGVIR
jgi:hypothetical protein